MADYNVIVIGAGIGGLAAGALMAKQGRKVLLLNRATGWADAAPHLKKTATTSTSAHPSSRMHR